MVKKPPTKGPYVSELSLAPDLDPEAAASYPLNIPAIAAIGTLPLHPAVTFLAGENGSGKSTVLEAIAYTVGLNPEGGTRNFNFATRESHSSLHRQLRVARTAARPADIFFFRAESYFNLATEIERLDHGVDGAIAASFGGGSLHEQSHGESFYALFEHKFKGPGLYVLDEPEAALSPQRQLAVVGLMHQLVQRGSQFIVATHSPIFMAYPQSSIYLMDGSGIRAISYRDCPTYKLYRAFMEHPELSMQELTSHQDDAWPLE